MTFLYHLTRGETLSSRSHILFSFLYASKQGNERKRRYTLFFHSLSQLSSCRTWVGLSLALSTLDLF